MNEITPETVQQLWWITIAVYVVVLLVVALLLHLILSTAKQIRGGVSEIWNVGQKIANNTIQIAQLNTTNHIAGRVLTSAVGVVEATAALKSHAESCPGCPSCVLGPM